MSLIVIPPCEKCGHMKESHLLDNHADFYDKDELCPYCSRTLPNVKIPCTKESKKYKFKNNNCDEIWKVSDKLTKASPVMGIALYHEDADETKTFTIWVYDGHVKIRDYSWKSSKLSTRIDYENVTCFNQMDGLGGTDRNGITVHFDLSCIHPTVFNIFIEEFETLKIPGYECLKDKIKRTVPGSLSHNRTLYTQNTAKTELPVEKTSPKKGTFSGLFDSRKKVSRDTFVSMYNTRCYKALCEKKDEYLEALEGELFFFEVEELYTKCPRLYNQYASAVLNTPLRMTAPMSPYTAAVIGTYLGGTAVGVVAAADAIEKQKAVVENNRRVQENEGVKAKRLNDVNACYQCIEYYVLQNSVTAEDWKKQLDSIAQEMNEEYRITK